MKAAKRDAWSSSRHKKLNDLCDLCLTLPCSNKMIGVSQPRAANWKVTHALITAEWGEGWVVSSRQRKGGGETGGLGGNGGCSLPYQNVSGLWLDVEGETTVSNDWIGSNFKPFRGHTFMIATKKWY